MKDFLVYLAKKVTDNPDAVSVDEESNGEITTLFLSVAKEDMGKVIGKEGRVIRAIRDLVRVLAVKTNTKVNVVLKEE